MGWKVDSEQRQARRISAELPLQFAVVGNGGSEVSAPLHASSNNVSTNGVSFVAGLSLPLHARVRVWLDLPGQEQKVEAQGLIVRIASERPDISGIEYGVRFDNLEPREALERYIRSVDIYPLLRLAAKQGASHLHLSAASSPFLRIRKGLVPTSDKPLSAETVEALIAGVMSPPHRRKLRRWREVSFPFTLPEIGRWHINVFYQRGFIEATFQTIHNQVPSLEDLGLPPSVREFVLHESGLVLISGPLNSGKSTTMAALVGIINRETSRTILTLDNPIEFAHQNAGSIVRQREVGIDVRTFAEGLRSALQQDFEVIAVSEVSDAETADMVLRAAETGRLVLAAFPTSDAVETLERLVRMRPNEERLGTLHILATSLRGIVSQRLLPQADGQGLALAAEVVTVNDGIRNAIRTDKIDQIPNLMRSVSGAQPLDASLRSLVLRRLVDLDVAGCYSSDAERLRKSLAEHRV